MHFRHCPRCKLLAMSGEYCAGCGAHLHGPPVTDVKPSHVITFTAIVLAGLLTGFGLGALGVFQAPAELTLTLAPSVEACAGTVAYTATLTSNGEPVPDERVTLTANNQLLETLRTDVNGRITSTVPFAAAWCGTLATIDARAQGTLRRAEATATQALAVRIPVAITLDAPTQTTAGTPTLITVRAVDAYDGTALRGTIVRLANGADEQYTTTDSTGAASFTLTAEPGTTTLRAAVLGDTRYARTETSTTVAVTTPSVTDRVATLQQHVVLITTPTNIGSGVIVQRTNERSVIITNRHVIEGTPLDRILVADGDERLFAQTVALAEGTVDLAIITTQPLGTPATVATQLPARGEPVIAIGNPLGLTRSVSRGIVSNTVETTTSTGDAFTVIQTDAAVNPGNSGGGLFLERTGELVGIVSAKRFDAEGIGFAIAAASFPDY